VKQAAHRIVDSLSPDDRLSIVVFDHKAKVLVPNQMIGNPAGIKLEINKLQPSGGTAIDEGMRLAIEELAKGRKETISQAFLLTDGENEHGDNDRCLKLAELAAGYNITLNTLGFGNNWNQDVLERIADAGGGTLSYIERPEAAVSEFSRLFNRIQSVGLTNAHLLIHLAPHVRLAELKPIAQVVPDTIELSVIQEAGQCFVRLGDLMTDVPRVVLANLYVGQLAEGIQPIAQVQVRYDDPISGETQLLSERIPVEVTVQRDFQPSPNLQVQQHLLALAKYRQTKIAETKLQQGDRAGAATMLQSAAKTALQMGDQGAATVLQENATRLQAGEDLSEADRKKTRIVSKTILQP
jgi:Ca-activated chloride channel family protein